MVNTYFVLVSHVAKESVQVLLGTLPEVMDSDNRHDPVNSVIIPTTTAVQEPRRA